MEPYPAHPEKWVGPGKKCPACKACRLSEERKEKEVAKKKRNQEEKAKVASKANGWDWPEPEPKIKNMLNKVADPSTKRTGKSGKTKGTRFTVA